MSHSDLDTISGRPQCKPWRRLSLKLLLLCVTTVCIGFGVYHRQSTINSNAFRFLEKQDVHYRFFPHPLNNFAKHPKIEAPQWQRDVMGDDYFLKIVALGIGHSNACDPAFWIQLREHRRALQNVELIIVYGKDTQLPMEATETLKALKGLSDLHLSECNLSPEWLVSCRSISQLTQVLISRPTNTPIETNILEELTQLKAIVLDHCELDVDAAEKLRDSLRQTFVIVLDNNEHNTY